MTCRARTQGLTVNTSFPPISNVRAPSISSMGTNLPDVASFNAGTSANLLISVVNFLVFIYLGIQYRKQRREERYQARKDQSSIRAIPESSSSAQPQNSAIKVEAYALPTVPFSSSTSASIPQTNSIHYSLSHNKWLEKLGFCPPNVKSTAYRAGSPVSDVIPSPAGSTQSSTMVSPAPGDSSSSASDSPVSVGSGLPPSPLKAKNKSRQSHYSCPSPSSTSASSRCSSPSPTNRLPLVQTASEPPSNVQPASSGLTSRTSARSKSRRLRQNAGKIGTPPPFVLKRKENFGQTNDLD